VLRIKEFTMGKTYTLGIRILIALLLALSLNVAAESDIQLLEFAKKGDVESIKTLLKGSADVNAAIGDGTTALHWAALRDNFQIARVLIDSRANADVANDYGATPLWLACTNRSHAMVELLLKAGANPNAALWSGETPLMNCARTGATQAASALISAGAYVDAAESNFGQTALMWAAAGRHSDVTRLLIDNKADISAKTIATADKLPHSCNVCSWKPSVGGFTPLLFAARSGDISSVRLFMEAGADPNEGTAEHGNSLVIASAGGHVDLALFLLQMGADPNSVDDTGLTALHHAVGEGLSLMDGVIYDPVYRLQPANSLKLARALLDAGAKVNVQIEKSNLRGPDGTPFGMVGATPLLLAATSADVEMMKLLGNYKADPNINTNEGITPLMAAAQAACTGTCAYQEGGNVANKDSVERAHYAVQAILDMGVDANATSKGGKTAMHIAAFTGSDSVVEYLAAHGAKVNVTDGKGETPWTMASGMSTSIGNRGLYGKHEGTAALLLKLGAKTMSMKEFEENAAPYAGAGL
jgi:ankyrin repeat protein